MTSTLAGGYEWMHTVGRGPLDHAHHWLLETPHGTRTIEGVCRDCGATKHFICGYEGDFMPGYDEHRERGRVARRGK